MRLFSITMNQELLSQLIQNGCNMDDYYCHFLLRKFLMRMGWKNKHLDGMNI